MKTEHTPEPKGWDAEFLSKRLGRVCARLGITQPFDDYEKNAEVAGTTLAAVDRSIESLVKQRDELLAALILASCCLEPNTSSATVNQIEAAIASVKEKQNGV